MPNICICEHQTFFLLSDYNSQIVIQDGCQRAGCYWTGQVTSRSKDQDRSGRTVIVTSHKYVKTVMIKIHQLVCEHSLPKRDWILCSVSIGTAQNNGSSDLGEE